MWETFGGEQPGDTYYYSPLNVAIFGLVNYATEILYAYSYPEGVAKKGGNNVASLIYKYLEENNCLSLAEEHGPGKKLSLIFDNCSGQNKNRMVMRFGQYIVDKGIFKEVEIIFLITGHTKNICDRRFKDLKQNFHHRNVYTFKQLTAVMKEGKFGQASNPLLSVHAVEAKAFYNWDKYLDLLYRKRIPKISTYHYFRFTDSDAEIKQPLHQKLQQSSSFVI